MLPGYSQTLPIFILLYHNHLAIPNDKPTTAIPTQYYMTNTQVPVKHICEHGHCKVAVEMAALCFLSGRSFARPGLFPAVDSATRAGPEPTLSAGAIVRAPSSKRRKRQVMCGFML